MSAALFATTHATRKVLFSLGPTGPLPSPMAYKGTVVGYVASVDMVLIAVDDQSLGIGNPLSSFRNPILTVPSWYVLRAPLMVAVTLREIALMNVAPRPATVPSDRWPHQCPHCGGPAYVGATPSSVDCKGGCRG